MRHETDYYWDPTWKPDLTRPTFIMIDPNPFPRGPLVEAQILACEVVEYLTEGPGVPGWEDDGGAMHDLVRWR